jgi:hypothetical protein
MQRRTNFLLWVSVQSNFAFDFAGTLHHSENIHQKLFYLLEGDAKREISKTSTEKVSIARW